MTCSAVNGPTQSLGIRSAASYQTLRGDAGLPYISGATVYSFSNAGIGKFIEEDEKTWMLNYGYNFAAVGVPGLTFSARYLSGNDGKSTTTVKEWERDAELALTLCRPARLKGLGVRMRNYVYRSEFYGAATATAST